MVECELPKLEAGVRFPSSAPGIVKIDKTFSFQNGSELGGNTAQAETYPNVR